MSEPVYYAGESEEQRRAAMETVRSTALSAAPQMRHGSDVGVARARMCMTMNNQPVGYVNGYPRDFTELLQDIIKQNVAASTHGALLVISIDNIAMIMRGYGHEISEQVIRSLMEKIGYMLSPQDVISRLQKDQIGLILPQIQEMSAREFATQLHLALQGFGYESEYGSLHVLCSIACISIPKTTSSAAAALDQAFISLKGKQGIVFPVLEELPRASANCRQEMGLANYLSRAIRENRLRLAYQPIISSKTGEISHYEALLRNISDDGRISSAGALIPVAERMGMIQMIDHWVLEKVVEELRISNNVSLAFNVSNLTTDDETWLDYLKELIGNDPDVASRMIVEITETAIHRDLSKTAYFVASIQALGAQVALDDFGSGYTSFRQLKSLSIDMVKIDGAFIRDLVDNADNRFFVKTLLDFTKGFGLKSVAEFVENGEIAKMLMDLGVEYMQGYYFGRPENHRSWNKEDE